MTDQSDHTNDEARQVAAALFGAAPRPRNEPDDDPDQADLRRLTRDLFNPDN